MKRLCIICGFRIKARKRYNLHIWSFKKYVRSLIKSLLKSLFPSRFFYRFLFNGYINICGNCGYGVMENPPDEATLMNYYRNQYWEAHQFQSEAIDFRAYLKDKRANYQVQFVLPELSQNEIHTMLEIGAGAAYPSLLLRDKLNIFVSICEMGEQWNEYYRQCGLAKIADLFPFTTDQKFDYIHTSHWLEHIPYLIPTIRELRSLLNPNSYVFVEVPSTGRYYWDIQESDTPHIQFFTPASLQKAFENNGFVTVKFEEFCEHDKAFVIRSLFRKEF